MRIRVSPVLATLSASVWIPSRERGRAAGLGECGQGAYVCTDPLANAQHLDRHGQKQSDHQGPLQVPHRASLRSHWAHVLCSHELSALLGKQEICDLFCKPSVHAMQELNRH